MPPSDDPFRHHPGLRHLVTDPLGSPLRGFDPETLRPVLRKHGISEDLILSAQARETDRRQILAHRPDGPLWVFGYGSLMWDPAFRFAEVLRAHAPLHERRMILRDVWGGRGTREVPGLMAALDDGQGCYGLIFRIEEPLVEDETRLLFARERAGPAYHASFVPVTTDLGPFTALTFVADHGSPLIAGDLTRDEMIEHLAMGEGFLGRSLDYGRNLVRHLDELRIPDPELSALVAAAEAFRAAR